MAVKLADFPPRLASGGDDQMHRPLRGRRLLGGLLAAALVLAALAAWPGIGSAVSAVPEKTKKKVLLLYPRSPDFPFYDGFTAGLKQRLQADPALEIRYYHEYQELLYYTGDEAIGRAVAEVLRHKFRRDKPDLIVAHSLISARFLDAYCRGIFGDTPVLVYNTRPVDIDPALRRANYAFCHPALEPAKNAALILDLLPSVRRLYVVIGNSAFERKVRGELPAQLAPLAARAEITYLDVPTEAELLARVRALDGPAAVLFVDFAREADDTVRVPAQTAREVAASSRVPVFGSYSPHVGDGVLGGYVLNMDTFGREVGALALAILQGRVAPGAVTELSVGEYRFDWAALQRWQISADLLPPGSVLLNEPPALWPAYRWPIAGALSLAVLVFVLLAVLLARQSAGWRGAERREALGAELIAEQRELIAERTNALRQSEDRFQKAFHHGPAMAAILSMADNRYVEVNQKFLDTLEYGREEVVGRTPDELGLRVDPDDRQVGAFLNNLLQTGELPLSEYKFRTKSGRVITAIAAVTLVRLGADLCRINVMQDVTREKSLEADLLRLDRLNLVGEMAAGIGHEVRNPMTTVRGYLQLFRRKEKFRDHHGQIDTMIEELDRANAIISEYLSLAKTKLADLRPGDLVAALAAIRPLLQADALRLGCAFVLEPSLVPTVLFDEKELRQLVLNLARNAFEATPAGGTVAIATREEAGRAVLVVRDTGHGIPPAVAAKLGTPFLTTKENGTGLGLSVCYRIAQRHGATIEFATGETGTTFSVTFPPAP
jgi:PAS domain S-box-containing protein